MAAVPVEAANISGKIHIFSSLLINNFTFRPSISFLIISILKQFLIVVFNNRDWF